MPRRRTPTSTVSTSRDWTSGPGPTD
jgi:hypothetical protein